MIDLKDLQEMAKNGEISEKLLGDEEFKSEFKKMIKEETGLEITDEQIPEIIKNFENSLQDEKVLKEAELEAVSGGTKELSEEKIAKLRRNYYGMKLGIALAGTLGGAVAGKKLVDAVADQEKSKSVKGIALRGGAIFAGGVGMAEIGNRLGTFILDKAYGKYLKTKYGVEDIDIIK